MDNLWLRHGTLPILTIPIHEFFGRQTEKRDSIVVMDVNEKEYWEGIQLITGQQYEVFLKDDLHYPKHRVLIRRGLYYTYDPLERIGH